MKTNKQKKIKEMQNEYKKKNDWTMFLDLFLKGGWAVLILIGGIMTSLTGSILFFYIGIGISSVVIGVIGVG